MNPPPIDYRALLRILSEHGVEFIVVGGVCAVFHGAPVSTFDLDIVHARTPDNLQRLVAALRAVDAIYRELPERRLKPDETHLVTAGHQLLLTRLGLLDVLGTIGRDRDFDNLLPHTVEFTLAGMKPIRMLDLPTLITSKQEAGRPKDLAAVLVLQQTLAEKKRE
jgi:hypothetical protein